MSLFTSGIVDGSESISFPGVFVIVSPDSASYSSDIQATFVKTFVFASSGVAVTSHSISIVSELKFPFSYFGKFS